MDDIDKRARAMWALHASTTEAEIRGDGGAVRLLEDGSGAIIETDKLRYFLYDAPLGTFRRNMQPPERPPFAKGYGRKTMLRNLVAQGDHTHERQHYERTVGFVPLPDHVAIKATIVALEPQPSAKKREPIPLPLPPGALWEFRKAWDVAVTMSEAKRRKQNFRIIAWASEKGVSVLWNGSYYTVWSPNPRAFTRSGFLGGWAKIPTDAPLQGFVVTPP